MHLDARRHASCWFAILSMTCLVPSCTSKESDEPARQGTQDGTRDDDSGTPTPEPVEMPPCGSVPDGGKELRVRFERARVGAGEACAQESQIRICKDGVFEDWSGTFQEEKCEVEGRLSCGDIPHGGAEVRLRYVVPSVPYGNSCVEGEQKRYCNNGAFLEWSQDFTYEACTVGLPRDCGAGRPHGLAETRVRYRERTLPPGGACVQETQTRSCDNGVYKGWSGTYVWDSCVVRPEMPGVEFDEQGLLKFADCIRLGKTQHIHLKLEIDPVSKTLYTATFVDPSPISNGFERQKVVSFTEVTSPDHCWVLDTDGTAALPLCFGKGVTENGITYDRLTLKYGSMTQIRDRCTILNRGILPQLRIAPN